MCIYNIEYPNTLLEVAEEKLYIYNLLTRRNFSYAVRLPSSVSESNGFQSEMSQVLPSPARAGKGVKNARRKKNSLKRRFYMFSYLMKEMYVYI